jgi:ribosomal protein S27E
MTKNKKEVVVYDSYHAKGTRWNQNPTQTYRYMECKKCGTYSVTGEEATAVTCSTCVMAMVEPPVIINRRSADDMKPRGWHFMKEYIDKQGNVFHRGVEQPGLKGTLKETVIQVKTKIGKKDKEKYKWLAAGKIGVLKKKLKKQRWKKDKLAVEREIKYFTRIVKGRFPKDYLERLYE